MQTVLTIALLLIVLLGGSNHECVRLFRNGGTLGESVANRLEDLTNIQGHLGRRFHEEQVVLSSVLFSLLTRNLAVLLQIALVARQGNHNVGIASSLELLHPGLGSVEGFLRVTLIINKYATRDIVHDHSRSSTSVVHRSQASVTLYHSRPLPGDYPDQPYPKSRI